jgi:hypothetical protein
MEAGRPLFIRLSLPPGLEEALEGLAREILRSKTDNILLFAAEYFENLVQLRGSKGNDILALQRQFRLYIPFSGNCAASAPISTFMCL